MAKLARAVRIIEDLLAAEQRLAAAMGADWPDLAAQIQDRLTDIQTLSNDEEIDSAITQLLFLGWETPVWPIFQEIMQAANQDAHLLESTRLNSPFTFRSGPVEKGIQPESAERLSLAAFRAGVAQAANRWRQTDSAGSQQEAVAKGLEAAAAIVDRYLNAGFFHEGKYVDPDRPLVLNLAPYQLRVNIGEDFWGPGTLGDAFPQELVEPYFEDERLPVTIAVTSSTPGLSVEPSHQLLSLPRQGDSDTVGFTVTPTKTGVNVVVVDVLYAGHLLQSRRLTAKTVTAAGDELPPSAWPVQDGRITFTRTTALQPDLLAHLSDQPRALTIVSEREPQLNSIGLRIFDHTGAELAFRATTMQETNLTQLLGALRGELKKLMVTYVGAGASGPAKVTLTKRLNALAYHGRSLYRNVLFGYQADEWQDEAGQKLQAALQPGTVVQIAPLTTGLSMPWELLYERPLHSFDSEQSRLCPIYRTHGPRAADCPHYGNGHVICPHGFWGYRYIIEQLPGRLVPGQKPPKRPLPQWIRTPIPAALAGLVYTGTDFTGLPGHWQRLTQLAPSERLQLRQLNTRRAINAFMQGQDGPPPALVYVYAHGGVQAGSPYLIVAKDHLITSNDLDAWSTDWRQAAPLLLVNACGSAEYSPDSFENLLQEFYRRGASGILGTQCTIYEDLVDRMMVPFLSAFLRQTPAGRALLDARRQLLFQKGDARGLAYSLFAAAELRLAEPVVVLPVDN